MKKSTIFSLSVTVLFLQWRRIAVESAGTSEAKVIGVKKGVDNNWMTVIEDEDAISGWNTDVKKVITKKESSEELWIFMYVRTDPKQEFKDIAIIATLCGLLENYNNQYKDHFATEIINMIFPRQKGSCDFKVTANNPIGSKSQLHTDADGIAATKLPKKPPYELEARILDINQTHEPDKGLYLFKVNFNIGGDINNK